MYVYICTIHIYTIKAEKVKIEKKKEVKVSADKTLNLYLTEAEEYRRRSIKNQETRDYKKCPKTKADEVTAEAARIARTLDLADRIDAPTESEAFITIKDHKETFLCKVDCRLINPAKKRISKKILDKINHGLRTRTGSNQWKSTDNVINWFNKIPNKSELTFFNF